VYKKELEMGQMRLTSF